MKIFVTSAYRDTWTSARPEAAIFTGLVARGHDVTIATLGEPAYRDHFRAAGVKILEVYPKRKICLPTIRAYRRELLTGRYDIAYGMNSRTIPNLAFAAIGTPVKLVTYRGSSSGLYRFDPTSYLTHQHPRVDAICCVSKAVERVVRSRAWKRSLVITTVYKGHDLAWFPLVQTDLSGLGIPRAAFVIACVANARPVKGVDVLLQAANEVLAHPDVHLLVIGRGVSGPDYAALRKAMPAQARVHLLEHRSDAAAMAAAASVYVQPSRNEGLPKTVIEAMAHALPTIVTDAGGLPELVVEGETGWVVPRGSPQALSAALLEAYRLRERLPAMGAQARARIGAEFTPERAVEGHIRLFESLLQR